MKTIGWWWLALGLLAATTLPAAEPPLEVGFAHADITPELADGRPVWLAGYGHNRRATGVHDLLFVRCLVLRHGERRIALASCDLVGVQLPLVQEIRRQLPDFEYVLLASTHNHEAPDVIGIWGPRPWIRGVDDAYLELVAKRTVEAIRRAAENPVAVRARYGTAEDATLLGDSRLPKVFDGVLRLLVFERVDGGGLAGLAVQWNCHPEALGSKNTLITADFPWATVAALQQRHDCPVVYFSGAVGGLMAPPRNRIFAADGRPLSEGQFEYAEQYGREVADLATRAVDAAEPVRLTPWTIASRPVALPLENTLYRAARLLGVLRREGRVWTGDSEQLGEPITRDNVEQEFAVETEVGYLRLGEVDVAAIPGEIYPELVYGKYQEPVEPNVDFPDAPLEPHVTSILPSDKWLLLGLANDEVGYIIPKRQWDREAPFAYGRTTSQYGEINSCGPDTAPIIMRALQRRVAEAQAQIAPAE